MTDLTQAWRKRQEQRRAKLGPVSVEALSSTWGIYVGRGGALFFESDLGLNAIPIKPLTVKS